MMFAVVKLRTLENAPSPQALLARTRQKCWVCGASPVAVKLVPVTVPLATIWVNAASVATCTR
jgi:hypothetical protein